MDAVIGDWLAQSPQRPTDAGEDLACVDQWLNAGLIDIGTDLAEDDIARSLEEFTGQEFFNESPPPFADGQAEHAPLHQLSASSQPTSSGDGPTSSGGGGGDGAGGDTSSRGLGHFGRGGAFRSFSTNDLQLLLEQQQANLLLPVTGLSAPPYQYGGLMGLAGTKARTRPALESVPEGAPTPGGPLPTAPPVGLIARTSSMVLPGSGVGVVSGELGTEATSPLVGASAGTGSESLGPSATQTFAGPTSSALAAAAAAAFQPPVADGLVTAGPVGAAAVPPLAAPLAPTAVGGAVLQASASGGGGGAGGLRHVPSTGTLSALMTNTLSFQREGTDESTQQQQQQELRQAAGGMAAASTVTPPAAATAPPSEFGSGAAAATAAVAAAAGVGAFPLAAVPGLGPQQSFVLPPPPAGMFGMAPPPIFSPAPSFPPTAFGALGLALPLPPANLMAGPPAGVDDAAVAAAGPVASAAVAPAGGGDAPPRGLRKSQSALELGAWRSASLELPGDVAEEEAVTGQKLIGRLTPEERLQRILRYRNKRNARNFNREIKYQCRKTLADSRPRVGGRFARNDDPNSVMPHQTKKAMRARQGPSAAAAAAKAEAQQQLQQAAARAAQQQQQQQQQQAAGGVKPSSSTSTTSTTSSGCDNQSTFALCATSGAAATAGAVTAAPLGSAPAAGRLQAAHLPLAAHHHPQAASVFATVCGLPYSYGMPGMPYTVLPPGAAAPGALPHGIEAAALQHHYAVVNAAAQAAAQGVYAHLGMAPAAVPMPLGLAGGGAFAAAPLAAAVKTEAGVGPAEVPPRVDTPTIDALWTHLGADLAAAGDGSGPSAASGALGTTAACGGGGSGGGATCMAVDG